MNLLNFHSGIALIFCLHDIFRYMDKFKQLHESKVRSMNLEQIEYYCKEFVEALEGGK